MVDLVWSFRAFVPHALKLRRPDPVARITVKLPLPPLLLPLQSMTVGAVYVHAAERA